MSKKLSTLGFEKQVYQPMAYFDKNQSAELASYCRSESTKYILFWIMDTASIDSESEGTIRDTIQKIRTQHHLTVISISHRVEFLKDTDRILVINDGIIEKETSYDQIPKNQ